WSDEHDLPSARAAQSVAEIARAFSPDVVAVHNVLDSGVVQTAAEFAPRFVYHLHDHRPFCPNGDRLYPQGGSICGAPMSRTACGFHSLVHGCAYGPRPSTLQLVDIRERVAQCVREADATIVFSQYVADLALRNGVAQARTELLEPPLDDASYAEDPVPRPENDAVLFAGRIVPSKGARSLVRALARIDAGRRPVLRIAGDGPDLGATVDEAFDRGVRIEYLGRLDAEKLRKAYDDATVVAVPSTWGEPFGLVGIEAFARGRPVAAYDSGGIAQWLVSAAGRLVPRGDEEALAHAIDTLLGPRTWPEASAGAFAAAQAYRLHSHVLRLRAIYGAP
ncbi:MAG TPA: glycosyltransferase, partial [Candidatus Cybelea sp.]|nr:glycosyltransferase [Candidatus Cybelea sp.]